MYISVLYFFFKIPLRHVTSERERLYVCVVVELLHRSRKQGSADGDVIVRIGVLFKHLPNLVCNEQSVLVGRVNHVDLHRYGFHIPPVL